MVFVHKIKNQLLVFTFCMNSSQATGLFYCKFTQISVDGSFHELQPACLKCAE